MIFVLNSDLSSLSLIVVLGWPLFGGNVFRFESTLIDHLSPLWSFSSEPSLAEMIFVLNQLCHYCYFRIKRANILFGDDMNYKKFKHNPLELIAAAESILYTETDEVFLSRIRAVRDVLRGVSKKDIAKELNCEVRTIEQWIEKVDECFDENGFESLRPRKSTGRKPKLTVEQKAEISRIITETFPFEYDGYDTVYWTGNTLSGVLSVMFPEANITARNSREYLAINGYQKPCAYPFTVLLYAIKRINIVTARRLLELIRSGKTEETIMAEYWEAIRQNRITRETIDTDTPTTFELNEQTDFDDEDDYYTDNDDDYDY